ncbi:hypothetical protein DAI22_12g160900 [Oryza sativa Japonica Group]|nr:hypothetical protein DAI22_12g160900 [Oryza sativa Japonica Group]
MRYMPTFANAGTRAVFAEWGASWILNWCIPILARHFVSVPICVFSWNFKSSK